MSRYLYPESRLRGIIGHTETKHGMYNTSIYRLWTRMKQRCLNPSNRVYHHYGGRGITVDEPWLDFENFYRDMGEKPDGMTLERVDNNKGYSKDNCVWATRGQQARNRRTTRFYTLDGVTKDVSEWAHHVGISHQSMQKRIKKWELQKALTNPKTG